MTCDIIATGSSGNAVVIGGNVLVDCGVSWRQLMPYIRQIELLLLTHEHGDHFNRGTIKRLYNERPGLLIGTHKALVGKLAELVPLKSIRVIDSPETEIALRSGFPLYVSCERIPHNAINVCYKLRFARDGKPDERVFYATDTVSLDHVRAESYDLYLVEANHTMADIEARIAEKEANGEYAYEIQAAKNHMSREDAESWLRANAGTNSRYVFLHQHKAR